MVKDPYEIPAPCGAGIGRLHEIGLGDLAGGDEADELAVSIERALVADALESVGFVT